MRLADYQMEKAIGKCFRSASGNFQGLVRVYGSWYDYKVIAGIPESGVMLEIIAYDAAQLMVQVNNSLFESDVNFIGNF
ncbi:MAG: hypothetical protein ACK5MW_09730 [Enterococcus sp.]